jgi:predicted ester cyclase
MDREHERRAGPPLVHGGVGAGWRGHRARADGPRGYMEGSEKRGHDEFLAQRGQLLSVFPDLATKVEDVIEEGAKVAVRWHGTATHGGDGLGVPPTNRRVTYRGITWVEFAGGQIVRGWHCWNVGGVMQFLTAAAG